MRLEGEMGWEDGDNEDVDYTEPEESAAPEKGDTVAGTVSVQVGRDEIIKLVAERFYANIADTRDARNAMNAAVEKTLTRMIKKAAEERINAICDAEIHKAVGDMFANGWSKTDQYGNPKGTVTVKQVVIDNLTSKGDSHYDKSFVQKSSAELFERLLKQEITPHVEAAKAQLKALLDKTVAESLKKALLEGAGLKI
jgi:histone H3/H4